MIPLLAALALLGSEPKRYQGDVAVWYGSHFESTDIHDWVPIREWNGPFHPMLGNYKTSDRRVVRKHLEWLRRAGVDVILYDVCRIQPEMDLYGLRAQKTLRILEDELSHQDKESRKIKLALWIERWNSNPKAEEYRYGLKYITKHLANKSFYSKLKGKPLVMRYLNGPPPDFSPIDAEFASQLTIRQVSPTTGEASWGYFYDTKPSLECMTVNPGADGYMEFAFINGKLNKQPIDQKALREHGKAVSEARRDGKAFEEQLQHVRETDPSVIFVSGWNDWAFCMQMEPAKEYGFRYVDSLAKLLGRWSETAPYRR